MQDAFKVLLVEDNEGDARLLEEELKDVTGAQFDLTRADRMEQAVKCLSEDDFDVLLLDLSLPDSEGIETVARADKAAPTVPIVVLTGMNDENLGIRALRQGAQDYLVKGQTDSRSLYRAIVYACERERAKQERQRLIDELQEALATVKSLSGMLPICASCKKIRDDKGYWTQVEHYIEEHSSAVFTHGICPDCVEKLLSAADD